MICLIRGSFRGAPPNGNDTGCAPCGHGLSTSRHDFTSPVNKKPTSDNGSAGGDTVRSSSAWPESALKVYLSEAEKGPRGEGT